MYRNCPEHPDIQRALEYGYEEVDQLLCPNCGTDLNYDDKVFKMDGQVIGCEHCIDTADAEDELSHGI